MLKLLLDQVHRKVGFELEDTPRFAGLEVIFTSPQEKVMGDQRNAQRFCNAGQFFWSPDVRLIPSQI